MDERVNGIVLGVCLSLFVMLLSFAFRGGIHTWYDLKLAEPQGERLVTTRSAGWDTKEITFAKYEVEKMCKAIDYK